MQTIFLTPYDNSLTGKYKTGDDICVALNTNSAEFTVTLPDASSAEGTKFSFTVIGNNNAIITPITGQFINELNTITLVKNEILTVSSLLGKYYIFGRYQT